MDATTSPATLDTDHADHADPSTGAAPSADRMARASVQDAGGIRVVGIHPSARMPVAADALADTDHRLFNRELSWLAFNERVLALGANPEVPLLERAKFLAIFSHNLDEFMQVRVAGLKEQRARGLTRPAPDGLRPRGTLQHISRYASVLQRQQLQIFNDDVAPALVAEGIRYSDWSTLDDDDRSHLVKEFEQRVFPVLTPLAVDPSHPFPYISNLSLNLAVVVRDPVTREQLFARIKIPPILPRFVVMPDGERYVPLEQVVAAHLDRLFPGMEVVDHHVFRVTRNADLVVEEDEADDLLLAIESELSRQRFGRVVRLEVTADMSTELLDMLVHELEITHEDVVVLQGPLDLSGLSSLHDLDRPELKYPPFRQIVPPRLQAAAGEGRSIFEELNRGDILLHHPYDDFEHSVQRFVEQAADDPRVLAIKQTLYRTSGAGSPIVRALVRAANAGKQVVALVELKARFDEVANIEWAKRLEEAGVHVIYGVVGLKTHTKTALVVRREPDGTLRRYAHIGTGNYNDKTADMYEDLGLLTGDEEIGADLSDLFNLLSGYSRQRTYRRLAVSPTSFRSTMTDLIRREAAEPDGSIMAKMNALVDSAIIQDLYAASRAGTPVDLIVRGICCLRPGVPGLSENIRVRSIVGRYLEHSRIFRFGSERRGFDYWMGSGDWMPRNLDRRVEAFVPVTNERMIERLQEILSANLEDDQLAWELQPDASWVRAKGDTRTETHVVMQRAARRRTRGEG